MSTPKIRILRKWQDFFKLTAKEKALSRMGGKAFFKFLKEGTHDQHAAYDKVLCARIRRAVYEIPTKKALRGCLLRTINELRYN